jgi:Dolichyl-phosphate-mannose-protein mannosyltransferase
MSAFRTSRSAQIVLIAITIGALAPFLNEAFHVDDPLFVWIAQQIAKHPLDPYGFEVNWSSFTQSMADVMQNPPLCSYYIAAVGSMVGWSEPALHSAFLIWPVLAVLGTFAIARRFCSEPLLAALLTIFSPVFLVSATSLMCDVMMLALWIGAIELWLAGLDSPSWWRFSISAILISAAALTKYFAIALVPLLAVYTIIRHRRLSSHLLFLLVPIAALSNYDFLTELKYGHALFGAATTTSATVSAATRPSHFAQLLIGLSFTGGCFFTTLAFVRFGGRRKIQKLILAIAVAVAAAIAFEFFVVSWVYTEGAEWPIWIEGGVFVTIGLSILALAAAHLVGRPDAESVLLFLWIFGTFFFGTFLNWSVTSRTLLPIAPALAILTFRYFERSRNIGMSRLVSIVLTASASIILAIADYREANCSRSTAELLYQRYGSEPDKVYFWGHWGFQYYMQKWGARPFERSHSDFGGGNVFVGSYPDFESGQIPLSRASQREELACNRLRIVSTSALGRGASFYSSFGGPLPWVVNEIPPKRFYAVTFK